MLKKETNSNNERLRRFRLFVRILLEKLLNQLMKDKALLLKEEDRAPLPPGVHKEVLLPAVPEALRVLAGRKGKWVN